MVVQEFEKLVVDNARFTHIEKGHTYEVILIVKSKHPDTGEWYPAVIYQQIESGDIFVRSEESFINNFEVKL